MGHHDHETSAPSFSAAVITVSDRSAAGLREDATGPAVAELLAREGFRVVSTTVVPDVRSRIGEAIREAAAADAALCVTCGGTGLSPRDVTPEATEDVCERMVPGLGELMRVQQ